MTRRSSQVATLVPVNLPGVVHQRGLGQVRTFCQGGHVSVPLGLAYRWQDVTCPRCALARPADRWTAAVRSVWDALVAAYGPVIEAVDSLVKEVKTIAGAVGTRPDDFTRAN